VSFTTLLRQGVTAGAAAGLSAALVLWLVVEPVIRRALVVEGSRSAADGHGHEPLVSRSLQVFGGLVTAMLVGVMVGVVFAVVYARAGHRLPGATNVGRAAGLALAGFVVVTLLPALNVPANPPGVGDPGSVRERTLLYVLTILSGLLAAGVVLALDRWLSSRDVAAGNRVVADTVGAVAGAVAVLVVVPSSVGVVPPDVPATLLWDFRMASLAQLATMWVVLGLVFGMLVESRTPTHGADLPARA
jgi:predicted cobalt transporter CbtA